MRYFLPLVFAILSIGQFSNAQGQTSEFPAGDSVAFSLNGTDYSFAFLMKFATLLVPDPETLNVEDAYPLLVDLAIDQELAAQVAQELALDKTPEVQETLDLITNSVLASAYISKELDSRLTEGRIQAAFADYLANFVPEERATASHILLSTEAEARSVIERLQAGEDFATLARELSTGPSGPSGGALGTFGKGQMVAPFEDAVFAMSPGTFSDEPLETQFGFHVIFLEDIGLTQPQDITQIEPSLVQALSQEIQAEIREELRANSNHTITPFNDLPTAPLITQ